VKAKGFYVLLNKEAHVEPVRIHLSKYEGVTAKLL